MGSPARRVTLAYVDGGILHELVVDVLNRLLVSRRGRSRLGLLEALYEGRSKESAPKLSCQVVGGWLTVVVRRVLGVDSVSGSHFERDMRWESAEG